MPGVADTGWTEQFCVGCRQTTWHWNGLCSNRDYHRGTDSVLSISLEPPPVPPAAEGATTAAAEAEAAPAETGSKRKKAQETVS